jgi:hypothetical protein
MLRGLPDPYGAKLLGSSHPSNSASGLNTVSQGQVLLFNLLIPRVYTNQPSGYVVRSSLSPPTSTELH